MENPGFTKAQIEYLNFLYPERTTSINNTDREIWVAVGERNVVKSLTAKYQEQLRRNTDLEVKL